MLLLMDVSRPHHAVAPAFDTDVLVVLARTTGEMTGEQVWRLVGRGTAPSVRSALERLVAQGLVRVREVPPAYVYSLNREHLAFPAVSVLAGMQSELIDRLKQAFVAWEVRPLHASMFGSTARGDGDVNSDIDLLVVRPSSVADDDLRWEGQSDELSSRVQAWTGNPVSMIDLSEGRVADLDREAMQSVISDGILLVGAPLAELLAAQGAET